MKFIRDYRAGRIKNKSFINFKCNELNISDELLKRIKSKVITTEIAVTELMCKRYNTLNSDKLSYTDTIYQKTVKASINKIKAIIGGGKEFRLALENLDLITQPNQLLAFDVWSILENKAYYP